MIATIASENATCASCGVATTSPTAYTPSTLVRMLPSTDDEAALVDLHARVVEPDALGARAAADAHDHLVDLEPLLAVLAVEAHRELRRRRDRGR